MILPLDVLAIIVHLKHIETLGLSTGVKNQLVTKIG